MSAAECCAKCILIFVNIIFILDGLAILAAGIFLLVGTKYLEGSLDDLSENINSLATGADVGDVNVNIEDQDLDLVSILKTLAIVLIVLGVFILVMGLLGCIGAIASNKCMLITYATIVFLLFAVKCVCFVCFMVGVFDNQTKDEMRTWIHKKYGGLDDLTTHSIIWNVVMLEFECCGVESYKDFDEAEKWKRERSKEGGGTISLVTPIACCNHTGSFPNIEVVDKTCATAPTNATSNWKQGCWDKLMDEIEEQETNIIIYFVIVFALEVGCAALAVVIVVKKRREENPKNYHY